MVKTSLDQSENVHTVVFLGIDIFLTANRTFLYRFVPKQSINKLNHKKNHENRCI